MSSTARPGYARFEGNESPEEIEAMMATAFSPISALIEGLRRAERRAWVAHYRAHRPRDERGRFAPWPQR